MICTVSPRTTRADKRDVEEWDLTGNNVLMIAGTRAKVTDFGMSKIATVNPRMTKLTMCPGNVLYMSPEALDEAKSYTAKLDIFSFGVIVIQILTRQFPNPTDRFRIVYVPEFDEPLRQVIPDTERRQVHLQLISDVHSLKPLAIQCLHKKENERPSAVQLSESLSELKQTPQYTESMHQAQKSCDIQQLQQQLRGQRILTEAKAREASQHQARIMNLQTVVEESKRIIEAKDRHLHDRQHIIEMKDNENVQVIETKERELQQMQEQLRASEQLVSEFRQSMEQKQRIIRDLQQTISAHERKIQQLEHQDTASRDQPLQPITRGMLQTTEALALKDTSKMTWTEGKRAPEKMERGAAVVYGNIAYFIPYGSRKVYSYQNILGNEEWTTLPDNPNEKCSLAVIDGLLTSV